MNENDRVGRFIEVVLKKGKEIGTINFSHFVLYQHNKAVLGNCENRGFISREYNSMHSHILCDTQLEEKLSDSTLLFVIAHEIGHSIIKEIDCLSMGFFNECVNFDRLKGISDDSKDSVFCNDDGSYDEISSLIDRISSILFSKSQRIEREVECDKISSKILGLDKNQATDALNELKSLGSIATVKKDINDRISNL